MECERIRAACTTRETIDDLGTLLEDLIVHVLLTTRESTPVSKDDQRKTLLVKVPDGLCSLVRRVGVPNLTGFHDALLSRVGVGRVSGHDTLKSAGLDSNDTDGDTAKTGTTSDNRSGPAAESLDERALIEETSEFRAIFGLGTVDEPSWVVRAAGRLVGDGSVQVSVVGMMGKGPPR